MSLIKKAHSLLLQARAESNPRKAMLLRKASVSTYNEMIAFSFIYGVVTGESDYANTTKSMNEGGNDFAQKVAYLIQKTHGLPMERTISGTRTDIAYRLAIEFFGADKLGKLNFYNAMLKGFQFALRSQDKAEDAIHNVLTGRNPVTDSEYTRAEERNQFAYAGKNHSNLGSTFLSSLASLTEDKNAPIINKFGDCKASILSTIGLLKERLKYYSGGSHGIPVDYAEDIRRKRNQNSGIERSVEDYLPSTVEDQEVGLLSVLSESAINTMIQLFQKGYGWKAENSQADRKALAFYFFVMKVYFEANELNDIVEFEDERELLESIALSPAHITSSGVAAIGRELYLKQKAVIKMVKERASEFLEELTYIYEDINPLDSITESAGDRSFTTAWTIFLSEIGKDIQALKAGLPLPINPSAEATLESASHIFKQGSKKKASLKSRVASLLRRYNQI